MVTDTIIGPYEIAAEILQRGLKKNPVIGENLSSKEERIHKLKPEQVAKKIRYECSGDCR